MPDAMSGSGAADDPYRVLGLGKDASPDEVTRAFRRLARARHPDVRGDTPEAEREYRRIRDAYELLRDPQRRAAYDAGIPARGRRIPVTVRSATPRPGADTTARLRVSLAEAIYGATRVVDDGGTDAGVTVRIPPGTATGTRLRVRGRGAPGRRGGAAGDLLVTVEVADDPCFSRHGRDLHTRLAIDYPEAVLGADISVETLDGHSVKVHVPAGTVPGARLRVAGYGVPATGRLPAGDLVVEIRLRIPTGLSAEARDAITGLASLLPPLTATQRQPAGGQPE